MEFISGLIKKKYKLFIIFFLAIIVIIFYNKSELNYKIIKYSKNKKIFIDRDYIDSSDSDFFYGKLLIQIPRHYQKKIKILSNTSLTIYRPICSKNDNKLYYDSWDTLRIKINIEGPSCVHKKIYFKKFKNFFIELEPGSPVSADPIFIDAPKKKAIIRILNKKE